MIPRQSVFHTRRKGRQDSRQDQNEALSQKETGKQQSRNKVENRERRIEALSLGRSHGNKGDCRHSDHKDNIDDDGSQTKNLEESSNDQNIGDDVEYGFRIDMEFHGRSSERFFNIREGEFDFPLFSVQFNGHFDNVCGSVRLHQKPQHHCQIH